MNIHEHGIEIEQNFMSARDIEVITKEVASSLEQHPKHGIRNADKKFSSIAKLVQSDQLLNKARSILGAQANVVRVIFFDKTPDRNWLVTWHQDKTVALSARAEITGWSSWSIKDGVHHVQPDLEVLDSMVTFRIHLDDADEHNGCLKVIPSSHALGLLSHARICEVVQSSEALLCRVRAGDLVLMKPHILHSSNKSIRPNHRRVVHIEYSSYLLPHGLTWV